MSSTFSRRDLLRYSSASAGVMATARLLGTTPALAAGTDVTVGAGAPTVQVARVWSTTARQRHLLARLDATHRTFGDGSAEFLLWDGDQARLRAIGTPFEIVDPDVLSSRRTSATSSIGTGPGMTATGEYRQHADYVADLEALVAAHGATGRCRLVEMNQTSLHGHRIVAIEIGTGVVDAQGNPTSDGRPTIVHDGMHHCREWPAGEMPMMWAHDLLENYGSDTAITHIVDNARTIILPLVNPDGFIRTREFPVTTSDRSLVGAGFPLAAAGKGDMWRKNLRSLSDAYVQGVTEQASDAVGIDLNRNYPFLWGDEEGSSSVPEDQTYRGAAPLSEPECLNVRDLTLALAPVTHITHHTSGELMLYAWGRDPFDIASPDYLVYSDGSQYGNGVEELLADPETSHYFLGRRMEAFNGYDAKQAFGLYPTSGTSRDYGHASVRSLIYTFEHGQEFHGSYGDVIAPMYAKNRGAFITHSNAAIDPRMNCSFNGRIVDSAGNPIPGAVLHVTKDFETPTLIGQEARLTTNAADGYAERLDRTVRLGADGGFTVVMPPSTRPFVYEERFGGEGYDWFDRDALSLAPTEGYTLVVETPSGTVTIGDDVKLNRGDHIGLGDIRI